MKVLLLQDGGEHEKNKHLRECLTLQKGIRNIGSHCDVWGRNPPHCDASVLPDFDSYDLVVDLWEVYHSRLDLSGVKTKKFLWSCDAHVQGEQRYIDIMNQGSYDAILTNAKNMFNEVQSHWFKPWIDLDSIRKKDIEKTSLIGFCGNRNPERNHYIDRLSNEFDMVQDIFVIGDDMVNAINSYHIHFNQNLGYPHGFSYRVPETLACGTLLLTNDSYMHEFLGLEDTKNCLIYNTFDDIIDKLKWVKEGNRIQEIADAGHKLRNQFSLENAAETLEGLL